MKRMGAFGSSGFAYCKEMAELTNVGPRNTPFEPSHGLDNSSPGIGYSYIARMSLAPESLCH